ncbi:SOS response-associated peptidase [Salegentibacter sp. LM13S]|uniref:SOS response-associated peptidase n=1 Tax=Salegentibacter lacus TaxID=2873599 RepID=UPI001CCAE910|nr:SOS response-associated peptidase family protein [Salegentibacter lacus]MBZ9632190.1 SOS response-associated peptidase [Salegentibacter lacus]
MCYETSLTKKLRAIEKQTDAIMRYPEVYEPWYHLSGHLHPYMFCIPMNEPDAILAMEWGLVPKEEIDIEGFRKNYNTLNARGESLLTSKLYREATRERRCLILADGFFEPHYPNDNFKAKAVPKYCYLEGRKLFSFAGIYTEIDDDYWTVSMVTTEANDFFEKIHNKKKRMPLVLDPDFVKEWLDPDLNDSGIKEVLATSFMREPFKAHSVANIYKRNINTNTPEILEPVEDTEGEQGKFF